MSKAQRARIVKQAKAKFNAALEHAVNKALRDAISAGSRHTNRGRA